MELLYFIYFLGKLYFSVSVNVGSVVLNFCGYYDTSAMYIFVVVIVEFFSI